MALKVFEVISVVLSAFVGGMFWGPWLALTRSIARFTPDVFLAIVQRMNRNMAPVMTVMMPAGLLSITPVLLLSFHDHPATFYLALAGFVMFVVALIVTMAVEVPIVIQMATWTVSTLPDDWHELRDRWGRYHVVRVVTSIVGLSLLVTGAIF